MKSDDFEKIKFQIAVESFLFFYFCSFVEPRKVPLDKLLFCCFLLIKLNMFCQANESCHMLYIMVLLIEKRCSLHQQRMVHCKTSSSGSFFVLRDTSNGTSPCH